MCGICGIANIQSHSDLSGQIGLIKRMTDIIYHRGPDEEGFFIDRDVALGMRRLSIIDLNTGSQPISNEDDTIHTIFNGEIYNFQKLQADLIQNGHHFKTSTDTEVIVHLYEEYGEDFVGKLNGMFGIALWDSLNKKLILARDRLGIKPLYYALANSRLIFGSEIKSILESGMVSPTLDIKSLDYYLTFRYVPGPYTMFQGIKKLQPGQMLVLHGGDIQFKNYWDMVVRRGEPVLSERDYSQRLLELMDASVEKMLVSDVPVGIMLSGGIDSSVITALATKKVGRIKTFSVGFKDADKHNETDDAKKVAEYYGTEHYELITNFEDHLNFLPQFIWHMDEPVANFSAITFNFISALAGDHVKVALSGQGSDELFAGYNRYIGDKLSNYYRMIPPLIRDRMIADVVEKLPQLRQIKRATRSLSIAGFAERFLAIHSIFDKSKKALLYSSELQHNLALERPLNIINQYQLFIGGLNSLEGSLYLDSKIWLPDDMLLTFDKMSMANSLELRVPYLDEALVEFSLSIPVNLKLNGFTTKYILKKAVQGMVPREIIWKKKRGFPSPVSEWLRGVMKDYAREILFSREARGRGYFNHSYIQQLVSDHISGRQDNARQIFTLLCLELWQRIFIDRSLISLPGNPNWNYRHQDSPC